MRIPGLDAWLADTHRTCQRTKTPTTGRARGVPIPTGNVRRCRNYGITAMNVHEPFP
jgi:hypothetical protein